MSAIRAVRLGSYSISATRPGTPTLLRLKSIRRYWRLCPPPRCREVRWPRLFRPPDFFTGSSSDFSGVSRVISSNPDTERNRVPAVIGRNCLMLISALEHGDRVAVLERDDRLLPPGGRAARAAPGHLVPPHLHGPDVGDRDPEQLLERIPDLVLVGLGMHLEGVFPPRLVGGRALLGHHRPHDDFVEGGHHLLPFFFFGAAFLAGFAADFLAGLAFLADFVADFLAALALFALAFLAVLAADLVALSLLAAAFAAAGRFLGRAAACASSSV